MLRDVLVASTTDTSASERGAVIIVTPRNTDFSPTLEHELASGQSWFWTDRWQAMEREADREIREGRVESFRTLDEFLDSLDADD